MVVLAVLTVKRKCPSCEISTQQGAVCASAYGDDPIELSTPPRDTLNADTEPFPAPPCAFETYRRWGATGENSLPNGPAACAGNGDPAAGVIRPLGSTTKLSMRNVLGSVVPTSTPTRFFPVALNRMSPGFAVFGSAKVEPLIGTRRPSSFKWNPV